METLERMHAYMCMHMHTQAMHMHAQCMCTHTHSTRNYVRKAFSALNLDSNEFHIVWELPQTPIFQLYKVIKGTFSKEDETGGKTYNIC